MTRQTPQDQWQGRATRHQKQNTLCVPLPTRSRALLEAHFALNDTFGKTKRTLQRIVKAVARRSGISKLVTPHILRHTFAVHSLQAGLSLAALQRILGHGRLETTQIYLNLSGEDAVREFLEKLG